MELLWAEQTSIASLQRYCRHCEISPSHFHHDLLHCHNNEKCIWLCNVWGLGKGGTKGHLWPHSYTVPEKQRKTSAKTQLANVSYSIKLAVAITDGIETFLQYIYVTSQEKKLAVPYDGYYEGRLTSAEPIFCVVYRGYYVSNVS